MQHHRAVAEPFPGTEAELQGSTTNRKEES
jgi:hypothetical protein